MTQDWTLSFSGLETLVSQLRALLRQRSTIVNLPEGHRIFGPGQSAENYLLLLDGSVRVQQFSESGRAIVLYRISTGESCVMTTACLIGQEDYSAEAIVETPSRAVVMPKSVFDEVMARSAEFRRFVFAGFSARLNDLFHLVEDIAFARMDIRLAHKLLELISASGEINLTQQQLAAELGSAREVVSRMLSEFQRRGWLKVSRGHIMLLNRAALEQLSRDK